MKFIYRAKTPSGEEQSGKVEATSKMAAVSLLQSYGLYVLDIKQEKGASLFGPKINLFQGVSKKELVSFTRQLAILFRSNVPAVESLRTIANQSHKEVFKEKITQVAEKVEGGMPLSQSLGAFPKIFSPFFIGVVKSGEATGKLAEVLGYLADHMEKEYNFQIKLKGALVYPIFVLIVFLGIMILMSVMVIPQLSEILQEAGGDLPWTTKLVIASSNFLRDKWPAIIIGIGAIVFFVSQFAKTKEGKEFFDATFLNVPFLGDFLKKVYLVRVAENLSTLIAAGFPIIPALEVTSEIVGNNVYKDIIIGVGEGVKRGEPISYYLSGYPDFFPPLFVQMMVVGEKTGQMDESLKNIVTYYEAEVERALDNFVKMLEPLLIIVLGLVTAILMASILLPLYSINFE